jgi:hypothetical protein
MPNTVDLVSQMLRGELPQLPPQQTLRAISRLPRKISHPLRVNNAVQLNSSRNSRDFTRFWLAPPLQSRKRGGAYNCHRRLKDSGTAR